MTARYHITCGQVEVALVEIVVHLAAATELQAPTPKEVFMRIQAIVWKL
jgi:hypothetical protein